MSQLPQSQQSRSPLAGVGDFLRKIVPFVGSGSSGDLRVEEAPDKDNYHVVRVEIPGIDPDRDLEVSVQDGHLTIKAERSEERSVGGYSEFRYGSLMRTVALPAGARDDDIAATYANGILSVRIRMNESASSARKIPVKME
ncbi:Hsp20/alpha crystallin family protein [Nocardia ninae]|uniref:14 kDa antigen n=1 Tax=Nocardia ninae NBRC 108245 TaxID=1210091 RepID=A0A511M4S0_9NOCA|nr:Hsp20/alpha crystallin family protein [Nocardia ninae]GEM35643.1 14 kDa antigen [Nocardia ninae NBRC 108245]